MLFKKYKIIYSKVFIRIKIKEGYDSPCRNCKLFINSLFLCSKIKIHNKLSIYDLCVKACNSTGRYNYIYK